MEIKIGVADIVDKMSAQDLKDTFAQYLEQHADKLFMESDGYWSKKITPFGKEVLSMLKDEIKKEMIADLMADVDFVKQMDEIKEQVKKDMGEAIQKGMVNYIVNRMFVEKEEIAALAYSIIREGQNYERY